MNLKKCSNITVYGNVHKSVTLIRIFPFSNYEIAIYGNYSDFNPPYGVYFFCLESVYFW